MLQKGVYPYEYMDDREKFNETSLPEKEAFFCHLNIEDITDTDYTHAKGVNPKDFNPIWPQSGEESSPLIQKMAKLLKD